MSNEICFDYLREYSQMSAPGYAVMLKGAWGSGKSHLVNQLCDELEGAIYVSLFGTENFGQIQDSILTQLHPVLHSSQMRFLGQVLKGSLKAAIKLDLDGDGKEDAAVEFKIPEFLGADDEAHSGRLLIFDDVERCVISPVVLFGYINYFIEHAGMKAVLVTAEDNITDDQEADYQRVKEKLVGITLSVRPDARSALEQSIGKLERRDRILLSSQIPIMESVFNESESSNLRYLCNSIKDFSRLSELIEPYKDNEEFIADFVAMLVAASCEHRSKPLGTISNEDLAKYSFFATLPNVVPSLSLWSEFHSTGFMNEQKTKECIDNSRYFASDERPEWVNIAYFIDSNDDDAQSLISRAGDILQSKEVAEIGVIAHLLGVRLWASDKKLIPESMNDVLTTAKENIDRLRETGELNRNDDPFAADSYGGLTFWMKESAEMAEFFQYVEEQTKASEEDRLPESAAQLLELMREDFKNFRRSITPANVHPEKVYWQVPILSYMDPAQFAEVLVGLDHENLRSMHRHLSTRYANNELLNLERDWLAALNADLDRFLGEDRSVKSVLLEDFRSYLSGQIEI